MLPVIALVGRPNVGKSTLYNRLTKTRDAIVADFAGLTRDRHYGDGKVGPRPYIVVDTGGFEPQRPEGVACKFDIFFRAILLPLSFVQCTFFC